MTAGVGKVALEVDHSYRRIWRSNFPHLSWIAYWGAGRNVRFGQSDLALNHRLSIGSSRNKGDKCATQSFEPDPAVHSKQIQLKSYKIIGKKALNVAPS